MKQKLLALFLSVLVYANAFTQDRAITGKVTGADDGQPLPGVSVRVKGTTAGTTTNADGNYSIAVPANATLQFSYIGYVTREAKPGAGNSLDVKLTPDAKQLTEVVVVGYGTQEKRDLTGSVGKVSGNLIANLATPSFDKQLAGRTTGMQVTVANGVLGSSPKIRIRGVNSISSGTDPLYVVDGVPIVTSSVSGNATNNSVQSGITPTNPLGDINPSDIESIEVLKDGSATAIYGSRAANGVVLITTKKGQLGNIRVNYDNWFSYSTVAKRFDLLNAEEFIQISNEKFTNTGATAKAFPTLAPNGKAYDTDWQDVVFRRGFQQNHSISLSGATESTSYYFSGAFTDLEGALVANSQRKYAFRGKIEQKALKVLTFGLNAGVTVNKNTGLNTGTNSLSGNVTNALLVFPNVPVKNPDGSYNFSADNQKLGKGSNTADIDNNYPNIQFVLDNNIYRNQGLNVTGDAFLSANIIEGLVAKTQIGINGLYNEDFLYWDPRHGDGKSQNGYVLQQEVPTFQYNWSNTLSYNNVLGEHKLGLVGGIELQKRRERSFYAEGNNLSNRYFGPNNMVDNTLTPLGIGGSLVEQAFKSYFVRGNYSFKDRYLLTATFRKDFISSLPIGKQDANLPGGSIGWRISDEPFFKSVSGLKFISDLKLRASYAKVGNTNIGYYPYAGTFTPVQYGNQSGFRFNQVGNNDLTFETSKKTDVGLDIGLWNNRITITADYFRNNVDGLILFAPTPPSMGIPGNGIFKNVGKLNNKGFEFGVASINLNKGGFTWTTDFNISFVKNKVTQLDRNQDIIDTYNITRVGESIGSFFGYEYAGVNPANGNPLYVKKNGDIVQGNIATQSYSYYNPAAPNDFSVTSKTDANGNVIPAALALADKKVLGQSTPTYFGGFGNTFIYKGFDLNVFFTFSGGNKVYNITRQENLMNQAFNNNGKEILNRWTTPGQQTDVPKLAYGLSNFINQNQNTTSRFLEDGDFIRAQNIGLGYTLPNSIITRLKLNRVRVYAQVQNAFIITDYSGSDPELSRPTNTTIGSDRQAGLDYNTSPTTRNFTFGLNIGF